jgi:hypothetical protein
MNALDPKAYSYRSDSGLIFDSIIITSRTHKHPSENRAIIAENAPRRSHNEGVANKIRAALAIRTQRATGILEHQPWE